MDLRQSTDQIGQVGVDGRNGAMLALDLLEPIDDGFALGAIERQTPLTQRREIAPERSLVGPRDYDRAIWLSPRSNGKIGPFF
jgi:hypothetical protein